MTTITIGTTRAVEAYREHGRKELLYRSLPGERTITTHIPEEWGLEWQERAVLASLPRQMERGARPEWVECEDAQLREVVLAHFHLGDLHRPAGWGSPEAPAPVEQGEAFIVTRLSAASSTLLIMFSLAVLWITHLVVRTRAGRDWQARIMGDPSSTGTGTYAPAVWMGLTTNTDDPDDDHVVLQDEITAGTLARKQCAYSHTNGTATYTLVAVWSWDQTARIIKIGIFTAATGGTLVYETLLDEDMPGKPGDTASIVETITL